MPHVTKKTTYISAASPNKLFTINAVNGLLENKSKYKYFLVERNVTILKTLKNIWASSVIVQIPMTIGKRNSQG